MQAGQKSQNSAVVTVVGSHDVDDMLDGSRDKNGPENQRQNPRRMDAVYSNAMFIRNELFKWV